MPKNLLIVDLKRRFKRNNPDLPTDIIDWKAVVPSNSTFGEGLEAVIKEYPGFDWS